MRKVTSAPRMQAQPAPPPDPEVESAMVEADIDVHDEPMTVLSFPAKRHEVNTDEDSVIVNATPVPPPMPAQPPAVASGAYPAHPGMVPPAPGSSPSFAEPPPRRPRAHEPTVMLVPKVAEQPPKSRALLYVVLGVSTLAVVLLLANLFMMRR